MNLPARSIDLTSYSEGDLALLHQRIAEVLPSLSTLDLNQEIVLQFLAAKKMLEDVRTCEKTPSNQKAQLQNTVVAILKQLADMQSALHGPEQARRREQALIAALNKFPEELREAYLKELEALLE